MFEIDSMLLLLYVERLQALLILVLLFNARTVAPVLLQTNVCGNVYSCCSCQMSHGINAVTPHVTHVLRI